MATTPQRSGRARQKSYAGMPGCDRCDVGGGEVGRCRSVHGEPELGQPIAEEVALGLERRSERADALGRHGEPVGDGQLEGRTRGIGEELLGGTDGGDQRRRTGRPPHLPPGERERLAARGDRQRALGHAGQGGQGHVGPLEDEMLIDLVGHRQDVVGAAEFGDQGELGVGEDLARRIVRAC